MTRFDSWINTFRWHYWSYRFARGCQQAGKGLLVKSTFRLRNAGRIELGENCIIDTTPQRPVRIDVGNGAVLCLGSNVYLNEGVYIACNIAVTIGDRCLLASDVVILDEDGHPVDWRQRHNHWPKGPEDRLGAPITIEDNVWIGTRAIILKGVRIGMGSVIAAGAVVTRDVPPYCLAAGVPARMIRNI